jgi:hypothetical protein
MDYRHSGDTYHARRQLLCRRKRFTDDEDLSRVAIDVEIELPGPIGVLVL